ncbi:hypothetical protein DFJ43DRAFT_1040349 [Lentinula guzmanii]|uniref:Uncharacterized protein n=1 Tax=Lentinula guzmanii TaxID=2804957 RepID=A0AA38JNS5_9AGAR|nr:hypothetical protein DFJ43DRAFT_1040349 [Lentinula guzmanii]
MVATAILSSLLALSSTVSGAAILKRDDGCSNFPVNGISTNSDYFSLWAQYDETDVELPLAMSTFGTSGQVQTSFLAPADDSGVTIGNLFQLNNSGLVGIGYPDGNDQTATWVSDATEDGGPLPFSLSQNTTLAGIAEDYCELVNTDPNGSTIPGPVLAAEGSADNWSICNRTDNALQLGLVFKAANFSADYGYNFTTCQSVHVFLRSSAIGNQA